MGDLIELLLYGAQGSWDCTNPDLETPIEMDCPGGFWWDENNQKQYTTLSPQKAVDFIKNTPEIRRLNSKQWVALSKRPTPEHSPSEEDLKIPSSRDPEDQETYHVIPQMEEIPDADALYARRKIVDERDRKLIRLRRDWKKSTATDDLNKMCVGKRYKSRKNIPTPVGYPEILCWYHIILFFLAPVYLILAVSLLMLEPPQIDPYDGPSTLVIILGLVMALIYSTFGFLPLRRMMLWFGLLIKE
jgi:hypothetical protein